MNAGIELSDRQRKLLAQHLAERGAKRRVAGEIGCTGQHLNSIISGHRNPSGDLLEALCAALELPVEFGGVTIAGVR